MKFKSTTLTIALALTLSLTGCNKTENPESSNDSTSTSNQTNATESTKSTESTESTDSEPLSDDVKRLIEEYPCVLDFSWWDGTVLSPSDIIRVQFPSDEVIIPKVIYGLSYMTYGVPCFATTIGNDDWKSEGNGFSNALDWLVYRRDEVEKSFASRDFFMVKPGDKLENGLVVKSAETTYEAMSPEDLEEWENNPYTTEYDPFYKTIIELDGMLTLEGILYKYAYNEDYNAAPNDVFFYPDTTKNEFVPMCHNMPPDTALLDSDVGVIHDGSYYLGNLDGFGNLASVDYDVNEVLGDKNYARVKITLKDICIGSVDSSTQSPQRAKIADIERID